MTLPATIGRYNVKGEVGRGGMATVVVAEDPRFGRDVAIKVLPREFLHDPTFRERFEREARTIAMLEHPAIVPVYDYGEDDGQPFLVMRYMMGGTLADRVKAEGMLSLETVATVLRRVAAALDSAHQRGLVHRDLKPGNILFDQYGEAYLSDFGIVKIAQAASSLTASGAIGTPAYMSPEQAYGDRDIDGRSDIYSLGVIVFEMLTGRAMYEADTPMGVVIKHILDPVPDISAIKPDLPGGIERVLSRTLAKNPEDRWQRANEFAEAFDAVLAGKSVPDSPNPQPSTIALPMARVQPGAYEPAARKLNPTMDNVKVPVAARTDLARSRMPAWLPWAGGAVGVIAIVALAVALFSGGDSSTPPGEEGSDDPVVVEAPLPTVTPLPSPVSYTLSEDLTNADRVAVRLELAASDAQIAAVSDAEKGYEAQITVPGERNDIYIDYSSGGGSASLSLIQPAPLRYTAGVDPLASVQFGLPSAAPLDLIVYARLGDLDLDLSNLQVNSLRLVVDSGQVNVTLPRNGSVHLDITVNGGDVSFELPGGIFDASLANATVYVVGGTLDLALPGVGEHQLTVNAVGGVTSLSLPGSAGLSLDYNGTLSRLGLDVSRLQSTGPETWETRGFDPAGVDRINLNVVALGGRVNLGE